MTETRKKKVRTNELRMRRIMAAVEASIATCSGKKAILAKVLIVKTRKTQYAAGS